MVCGHDIQLCVLHVAGIFMKSLLCTLMINFPQLKSRQVQVVVSQPLTSTGFTISLTFNKIAKQSFLSHVLFTHLLKHLQNYFYVTRTSAKKKVHCLIKETDK